MLCYELIRLEIYYCSKTHIRLLSWFISQGLDRSMGKPFRRELQCFENNQQITNKKSELNPINNNK